MNETDSRRQCLRDQCAAAALTGYVAHGLDTEKPEPVASWSYPMADALLQEREEPR